MAKIIIEVEKENLDYGALKELQQVDAGILDRELFFTEVFKKHLNAHPNVREIACLKAQFPAMLAPIAKDTWFAGEYRKMLVGVDPERGDSVEAGYYCKFAILEEELTKPGITGEHRKDVEYLIDFWKKHSTFTKCRAAFPEELLKTLHSDDYYSGREITYPMFGLGGPYLDYEKLIKKGVSGLREEIELKMNQNGKVDSGRFDFYKSLLSALDLFSSIAEWYAEDAAKNALQTANKESQKRFEIIAESLRNIAVGPAKNYHQGVQLLWLFNLVSLTKNYGRLDIVLGDLLANDVDNGVISYEEAIAMTVSFWQAIVKRGDNFNNRIIIGGKGRPNPENADRFAMLALEVQGIVKDTIPQLSLRWHKGMDELIYKKAFETLSKGSTFPMIYNDDINVPASQNAFSVPYKSAEQYIMYGCGEYVIDHESIGSPDGAMNNLKALNVTLHNGWDPYFKEEKGLALGSLADFATFEELQEAFKKQVEYHIQNLAKAQEIIYQKTSEDCAFPFLSLLYDDCIERGKSLLNGGVRFMGGEVESFGNNSAGDALYAIKKMVYEQKVFSSEKMLAMLKANFEGYEKERQILLNLPKFGNDHRGADAMSVWVNTTVANACRKQSQTTQLDNFLMVMINNGDSIMFGKTTAASADGRKAGQPLSNGNQPGAGNDKNGMTALLNSMTKLDPGIHAGAVHNVKISRELLNERRDVTESLFKGYFNAGGTQAMITVTDKSELEDALVHPENYANLIVRVGGYSERFIDLPQAVQVEIINRTLY